MAPLDDAFLRIDRAEQHLTNVKRMVNAYLKEQSASFVIRVEGKSITPPPPPRNPPPQMLGVRIGETVQNLRTALDYLVYQLAWFDSGPSSKRRTQFLIEDHPKTFKSRQASYLAGLSADHKAAIEAMQPYNGGKWLAVLRDISNTDKHNVLELATGVVISGMIAVGLPDADAKALGGFKRPGDKVGMYYEFPGVVTFRDGNAVIQTLELLKSETRALLQTFEPEFKGWEIKTLTPSKPSATFALRGPLPPRA